MSDIKKLIDKINRNKFESAVKEANTSVGKLQMYWNSTVKFWYQVGRGSWWIYTKAIRPVAKKLLIPVTYLYKQYQRLWFWWVYNVNEYGVKKFSVPKAGVLILATLLFFWNVPGILTDGLLYSTTAKYHVAYLNDSQEVHGSTNVFAVRGCDDKPICSDQDTVYYRVNPDTFNQLWSFWVNHTWFLPDYVAAAVKPTTHRCEIHTYGIRWKWLVRNWDVYPDLLQAKCFPLDKDGK